MPLYMYGKNSVITIDAAIRTATVSILLLALGPHFSAHHCLWPWSPKIHGWNCLWLVEPRITQYWYTMCISVSWDFRRLQCE